MREIKFRVWHPKDKFMGVPFHAMQKFNQNIGIFPDDAILMQYTGLHDKNGKEIYEGDILRWHYAYPKPEDYFIVKWLDFRCAFSLFRQNYLMSHLPYADLHTNNDRNYEVIGNIYENPELVKEA